MTKCKYWEDRYISVEYSTEKIHNFEDNYFSLCLILQGTAVVEINGTNSYISAPVLLCLNPDVKARIIRENNIKFKTIFFAPDFINRNLSADYILSDNYDVKCKLFDFPSFDIFYNTDDLYKGIIPVDRLYIEQLKYLFDTIIEQCSIQPDNMWSCRARMSIMRIFDFAANLYKENFGCNIENDTVVDCVLNYIEFNYNKKVSISDFCKWNNTNRTTLMAEFKKFTGKTINEFIIEKRIEVSKQILAFTNISIEEISEKCGFSNQSYFTRIFRQKTGMSPNSYRKSVVEKRIAAHKNV